MAPSSYNTLFLDLGGVCFTYTTNHVTTVPRETAKRLLDSPEWHDFERGLLEQEECYKILGERLGLEEGQFERTIEELQASLTTNQPFVDHLKELKDTQPGLRMYAITNISKSDLKIVKPIIDSWDLFEDVFASAIIGVRKPDLAFYYHVLKATRVDPETAVFVDDNTENVLAAHILGIHSIVFDTTEQVSMKLLNILGDPVERGMAYLNQNAGKMFCESNKGVTIRDNFSQLLIVSCTGNRSLVALEDHERTWNYFIGDPVLTTSIYPHDMDTTAVALLTLDYPEEVKHSVMDEMLNFVTADGIILTYFDRHRPRVDAFVCANVLRLFSANGRGHQLVETFDYLRRTLKTRAYHAGTRYYHNPDWFLYYVSGIRVHDFLPAGEADAFRELLRERVTERMGCNEDIMGVALRVLAAQAAGLRNERDLRTLLARQQRDGGWEMGWVCKYGKSGTQIGSRALVTAMAVKGITDAGDIEDIRARI
ncbi:Haloacid dehalogenase-like hydrolase-domain-containing protein [Biscogniauxia marginata]|nr:Haloacid dehalogenase-like hydrolase-domain-containing protein [Biscogniauxia marginata]